jgi:predicted NACHT family NTPase
VRDLFINIFKSPVTLADIGISEQRKELAMQAIAQVWTTGICNVLEHGKSLHDMLFTYLSQTPEVIKLRQQGEEHQALEHARERVERVVKDLKDKIASEKEEVRQIYKQITAELKSSAFQCFRSRC